MTPTEQQLADMELRLMARIAELEQQLSDLTIYHNALRGRFDRHETQPVPSYTTPGHGRWRP